MHDISDIERRGLPAVFVASGEFVSAADTQAAALGFDPERVFTEHPIQDRSDDEMRVIAEKAYAELVEALTSGAPAG